MKAVFLSDAHILDHADPNLPPLLAFLETLAGRTERLYIVGDLFDTWFAFRRAVFDEYVPLLGALERLKRAGTRIVYVTGNHDFEMGGFFEKILEAEIHDTQFVLEEDGRRALVAHGDMVNAQDRKYRRLRRVLRARPARWLGRNLPPAWVWWIARKLTVHCTGEEAAARMPLEAIFRDYTAAMHREGYDAVILGHLHRPRFEEAAGACGPAASAGKCRPEGGCATQTQTSVNLGDWQQWRTFLRWEDGRLRLMQWRWPEAEERAFSGA